MGTPRFEIIARTAKTAIEMWERQYGRKSFLLACGRNAKAITVALLKLKSPTKRAVNKIIGDGDGWTTIWCLSCSEYKPRVASFGNDHTVEVCADCLSAALAAIKKPNTR